MDILLCWANKLRTGCMSDFMSSPSHLSNVFSREKVTAYVLAIEVMYCGPGYERGQ